MRCLVFRRGMLECREYMAGAGNVDRVDTKLIAYLLARFACNNHTICDEELQVVGKP